MPASFSGQVGEDQEFAGMARSYIAHWAHDGLGQTAHWHVFSWHWRHCMPAFHRTSQ
jgi:hypothetical protein